MYKSLHIQNFRGFRNLEIPDLAPVTLITGPNNVGKTAVLEALFLHSSGPRSAQALLAFLRPYRTPGSLNVDLTRFSTPWEVAFYNRNPRHPIVLSGQVDDKQIELTLSVPRENQPGKITAGLESGGTSSTATTTALPAFSYSMNVGIDTFFGEAPSPEHREFVQSVSAQIGQTVLGPLGVQQVGNLSLELKPEENSDVLLPSYFLGPQNRSSQNELAQKYTNIRLMNKERSFLNLMRAVEPSIRSIEILAAGSPNLYVTLRGGPALPMSAMGEGMISVANYAATILEARGGLVLVDEIENGIHYSALEKVWGQVGRAVRDTGAQVVATTHSYECVRAAHIAFKDYPSMLQLLRLQPGEDSPSAIFASEYDSETLEGALDMGLDLR